MSNNDDILLIITAMQLRQGATVATVKFFADPFMNKMERNQYYRTSVPKRDDSDGDEDEGLVPSAKDYFYKVPPGMVLAKDDLVVAEARGHYFVVKVTDPSPDYDIERCGTLKWIVSKLDTSHIAGYREAAEHLRSNYRKMRLNKMADELIAASGINPAEINLLPKPTDDSVIE